MTIKLLRGPISLALLAAGAATASAGTVYTETNSAGANAVQIFQSASDGSLSLAATVSTGGLGTGAGLGNQGALAFSGDDLYLYAVNAGSNEISAFAVSDAGLTLVDRVPSGGTHPISVTTHGRLVYVLNSGDSGNISGFHVGPDGHLRPISGSSRPLSSATAGPAEVSFSPDGSTLVVTEKALNQFAIYTVEDDVPSAPVTRASSGMTPFGFAFAPRGTLLVSEAFGGQAGASALSSYEINEDVSLEVVSGSVPTNQTAACWVVVARHGTYAYTTNTGSGTVTGYRVARSGELTRLSADGISGTTGGGPTDGAIAPDGRTMYVLSPSIGQIVAFRVQADGSLLTLGSTPGVPGTATGLAVR